MARTTPRLRPLGLALAATAVSTTMAQPPKSDMALAIVDPSIVSQYQAACLDGSPPAFWYRFAANTSKWIIAFEGGAWCWQLTADPTNPMASCPDRYFTNLGTSAGLPQQPFGVDGMMSPNATINPRFYDYNAILIHYCDGSFFTSSNAATVPGVASNGSAVALHFRGFNNVMAVLEDLRRDHGLGDGSAEVIITGGSAGGQAAYIWADRIRESVLPPTVFPGLIVTAVADAGMFLDAPDYATGAYQYRTRLSTAMPLWQSVEAQTLDLTCLTAFTATNESWKAFFPQYCLPYISTPLFVTQSAIDAEQLYDDLQLGCCPLLPCANVSIHPLGPACGAPQMAALAAYRELMLSSVVPTLEGMPGLGAFIDTCYVHVQGFNDLSWGNYSIPNGAGDRVTLGDAVGQWYDATLAAARGTLPPSAWAPIQYVDPAAFLGNPSCPFPPPPPPRPPHRA